ncbi:MAG: trimethylamine methyltransferase family protein [Rhodospirillales bacterium]
MAAEGGRRGRGAGGGREARRASRQSGAVTTAPYISRKIPFTEFCSEEQINIIENNADTILAEIGIEFRDDAEVIDLWKKAGAKVEGERVRFEKGMLREIIKTAPSSFTQHARNPAKSVEIGGGTTVFAPVYGPPFVRDLDQGRRYGTIEDFQNFVKLIYSSTYLHHSGGTVCEPVDVPVNKRHLDMVFSHMRYSDKPFMGSVTAPERAQDTVEMCRILFGEEFVDQNCVVINLINANSPMVFDETMVGALKVYARANQACVVSPFIISGAMSPASVAGTLTQALAEGMAGCALTQLIRPGAPVVFGMFSSSMSMQSGAPTFGTPEPALILTTGAQLVRRLGLPFRSGGSLCGSKVPDAQAAYESANTLLPAVLAGVNFMLHSAGWLEGGLVSSYEKLIMDADQLGMMQKLAGGVDVSEEGQAMDAIREVGPGKHYLGCGHTNRNFETAFYSSKVADYGSFEQWEAEGALDTVARANVRWKKLLAQYEAPEMDPGIEEALGDFVASRKSEMPDASY